MNRRSFLALVAGAPLVAALKPWGPPSVQEWVVPFRRIPDRLPPTSGTRLPAMCVRFDADETPVSALHYEAGRASQRLVAIHGTLRDMRLSTAQGELWRGEMSIPVRANDAISLRIDWTRREARVKVERPVTSHR